MAKCIVVAFVSSSNHSTFRLSKVFKVFSYVSRWKNTEKKRIRERIRCAIVDLHGVCEERH